MKGHTLAIVKKLARMPPTHNARVRKRTADRERRLDSWRAESRHHTLRDLCVVRLECPIRQLLLHDLSDFVVRHRSAVLSLNSTLCSAVVGLDGLDQEVVVLVCEPGCSSGGTFNCMISWPRCRFFQSAMSFAISLLVQSNYRDVEPHGRK
jgi:hypothetical protein